MRVIKTKRLMGRLMCIAILSAFLVSCVGKQEKKEAPLLTRKKIAVPKKEVSKMTLGKKAFIQCAACHSLKKGEPHKVGPNLNGVFGRKAASLEDFNYSEALKGSDIVWSDEHIRNWLAKPSDYVPGTNMAFIGIKNKKMQDALIGYLKEETK